MKLIIKYEIQSQHPKTIRYVLKPVAPRSQPFSTDKFKHLPDMDCALAYSGHTMRLTSAILEPHRFSILTYFEAFELLHSVA